MNKKVEEAMNNKWVIVGAIVTLAFGGGNLAVVTSVDDVQLRQQKIDSLNTELTKVSEQMNHLKQIVNRVESDSKERTEATNKRLEKLEEKQDRIISLLMSLKK